MAKHRRRIPRYLREDPAWQAEVAAQQQFGIPPGAIRADFSQQAPNNSWFGRDYYQDYEFNCVDCGTAQVWTAAQQQWWYEVAKGSIYTQAKRCRACRATRRQAHGGTPRRPQTDHDAETGK